MSRQGRRWCGGGYSRDGGGGGEFLKATHRPPRYAWTHLKRIHKIEATVRKANGLREVERQR